MSVVFHFWQKSIIIFGVVRASVRVSVRHTFYNNIYMLFDMGSQRWILMKLSQEVPMDSPFPLTPSPGPSGTSMSSKTPESDLEDRWSLDTVSDYGSWWNFRRSFRWIVQLLRHHLKVHQEPPWLPLTFDLDETFTEGSDGLSLCYDTISRLIRNLPVLQDSRKWLGG